MRLADGRRDPVPARGDRDGQQHGQRERATIETARSALVRARARADEARALPARARHHRVARTGRRLQRDVGAAERRLARRAARRVRAVPARHAGDVGRGLSGVREARARHDDERGDARRRARAVPRARVRPVLSRRRRWSRRSAARCARWASIRRRAAASDSTPASARGSGRARSARRCACRTRCTSCCVRTAVRRTGRPSCTSWDTRCTSRTCAPTIRWSIRWLGDNSMTEGYAMLFDHLHAGRAGGCSDTPGLDKKTLPAYLRAAGFEELHFLRRYCAKLIYETQLYGGDVPWDALPDLYVEQLTGGDDVPLLARRCVRRRRSALLRGALSARVAAAGADHGDARRAVRRGLVAESARGSVDRAGAVRRGAARAGARAGGARGGEGAVASRR